MEGYDIDKVKEIMMSLLEITMIESPYNEYIPEAKKFLLGSVEEYDNATKGLFRWQRTWSFIKDKQRRNKL